MQKVSDPFLSEGTTLSSPYPIGLLLITDAVFMGGDTRCEVWLLKTIDKQRFSITAFTSSEGRTYEEISSIADIRHISARFGVLEDTGERRSLTSKLRSAWSFTRTLAKV